MNHWARKIILFVAAIAAMAGIGIFYTQVVQPKEPVWLPQAKIWEKTPLKVSWDREFWDAHNASFEKAIELINSRVGCKLFAEGSPADVTITSADGEACKQTGVLVGDDDAAGAWLCPGGTADIQIAQPGDIAMSRIIAQHELLHVAGLGHDSFSASIMMSGAQKFADASPPPRITDKDAAALKARYCDDL